MLANITNPFIDWMFPKRCLICDAEGTNSLMCRPCLMQCHRNNNQSFIPNGEHAFLFHFELSIRAVIKNAKYKNHLPSAHVLCSLVEHELKESSLMGAIRQFDPQAVTFVPRHFIANLTRTVELPYLFAHMVASVLERPVVSALVNNHPFDHQAKRALKQQRIREIKGKFSPAPKIAQQRLLIVDDVMTTGATLREAHRVLSSLGVDAKFMAIAKTP